MLTTGLTGKAEVKVDDTNGKRLAESIRYSGDDRTY